MVALLLLLLGGLASPPAAKPTAAPAGKTTADPNVYHIPYRLTETNHLLVRAKLNGHGPYRFIIDTGAPALFFSKALAEQIGVTAGKDGWGTFDRLEVEGGLVLKDVQGRLEEPSQLKGMNAMGLAGTHIDGIFGYNLLARFRIEIDCTQPTLTWTKLNVAPPAPRSGADLAGGQPIAPSADMAAMENLSKMASVLFAKKGLDEAVPRGFLGVEVSDRDDGVYVRSVLPESPAAKAGLLPGDRIAGVALPEKEFVSLQTSVKLLRLAAKAAPDAVVRFQVVREKKTLTLAVKAGRGGL
jgi:hypothetical protein